MAKLGKYLSIGLVVILAVSSMLIVIPTNAQSTYNKSATESLHQISNNFSLIPERFLCIRITLEKNQSINGSYTM